MDRMTTLGTFADSSAKWLRAHWPALLLPAVVAELIGLGHDHAGSAWAMPWLEVALGLAVVAVVLVPVAVARVAPFALFGYGFYGLLVAHHLLLWRPSPLFYGVVDAQSAAPSVDLVLPEAFAFMAAALWLLAATGGPGGAAVRRAVHQLFGVGGERKTVPALLLLPVLGLWLEALANPLWYGFGSAWWRYFGVAIMVGGVALVVRRPRVAAVVAVAGMIVLGLVLLIWVLNGAGEFIYYAQGRVWGERQPGFSPAAPGAFSGMYGLVLLDNPAAMWLTRVEGVALVLAGCLLAPRTVAWAADPQLARRAAALTQRVDRLSRTRTDATNTAVAELRRIERDLHDGAQARLVAVGMALRAAEELMLANPQAARALVAEARETSSRALDDLRDLVRGIYPPVLADRGLADAVRALALDAPLTVETDITLSGEPPMPVAAAVYFGIAEALTNAVRHSGAETVQIGIGHAGGLLRATIADNGTGGADPSAGTGLSGVEGRLATFDGILAVTSPMGGPTIVVIEVPCTLAHARQHVGSLSVLSRVRRSTILGSGANGS
jgi:signal transduction histidine kinase